MAHQKCVNLKPSPHLRSYRDALLFELRCSASCIYVYIYIYICIYMFSLSINGVNMFVYYWPNVHLNVRLDCWAPKKMVCLDLVAFSPVLSCLSEIRCFYLLSCCQIPGASELSFSLSHFIAYSRCRAARWLSG